MGTTLTSKTVDPAPVAGVHRGLPLQSSVLGALAYADLFDAPLSLEEISRYQITCAYSPTEIATALETDPNLAGRVTKEGSNYCLKGRETLFAVRHERSVNSARVWGRARFYARWLRRLPFVRMVAVTGALAVDNLNGRDDIDLLVVSSQGRVWLCRRGLIGWVRFGRLLGDDLCPNYIISEASLALSQRDFFTAHELAQMVPLFGSGVYRQMLDANRWAEAYLPSLVEAVPLRAKGPSHYQKAGPIERVLQTATFDRWERWELERLRKKLRFSIGKDAEVVLTPDQCKGHTGLHRAAVMKRYMARLEEMGLHDVVEALGRANKLAGAGQGKS